MNHYVLTYEKDGDFASRQAPLQPAHVDVLRAAVERGELLLAGNIEDAKSGRAMLLFRGDSPRVAEAFAAADPYVKEGVVTRWTVHLWDTTFGPLAAHPMQPK